MQKACTGRKSYVDLLHTKQDTMKASEITPGTKFTFTPTSEEFVIVKTTDKRISWFVPAAKSHYGKNTMRMAWSSINQFQTGLDKGTYIITTQFS